MATDKQLFVGQTNHPLSKEEIEAFYKKVRLHSKSGVLNRAFTSSDKREASVVALKTALDEMLKTPTGREQARAILASKKSFDVYAYEDANDTKGGYAFRGTGDVYINLRSGKTTPEQGAVILHELLHARQVPTKRESGVLADSETMALSNQLEMEINAKEKGAPYQKSFEYNKEKWKRIARTGRYPKGFNGLKFKAAEGLSAGEQKQAIEMYAHQMASLETRADATKDFAKPVSEWEKNPSLKYPDYGRVPIRENYREKDFGTDNRVSKQMAQDIASRNPFLDESDFHSLWKERENDRKTDKAKPTSERDGNPPDEDETVLAREKDPELKKRALAALKKMNAGKALSPAEQAIYNCVYQCNLKKDEITVSPEEMKKALYAEIGMLQNSLPDNALRAKIIRRVAKALGIKELPIAQNEAGENKNLINTLNQNAHQVPEQDMVPYGRGGREGMA